MAAGQGNEPALDASRLALLLHFSFTATIANFRCVLHGSLVMSEAKAEAAKSGKKKDAARVDPSGSETETFADQAGGKGTATAKAAGSWRKPPLSRASAVAFLCQEVRSSCPRRRQ